MARLLLRDLQPGTEYKLQVRSTDGNSFSEWSRIWSIDTTSDLVPPDVPNWAVTDPWVTNGDTFIATWQPLDFNLENNKDFSHYELRITDGVIQRIIVTSNTSYTLTFDTNSQFFAGPKATLSAQVRSVDRVGNVSAYTSLLSATNAAPATPSSLAVTALYDSVKVEWSPVADTDLVGYKVFMSTTSASTGFTLVHDGPETSYVHNTVNYLADHWYRVYAYDKFNTLSVPVTSSAVKPKSTFAVDSTPPDNATAFAGTAAYDTTTNTAYITYNWTASATPSDVAYYEIRYGFNGTNWQYIQVPSDVTSFRLNNLLPSTGYYASIRAVDPAANESAWLNDTSYPRSTVADTTAPSQPAAPTAAVGTQKLQVVVSGNKQAGGAMETDVSHYQVFASTTNGFTTYDSTTMLGTIEQGPAMVETFNIPASSGSGTTQTWYVKVRAVDRAGNVSPASNQVTAAVGLILTANIGDAQITNAKISDLAVDKLTAGTGIATDFTIKSTLTLGESGNDGVIRSYDYGTSGGATGFSLDSDGLIIKTGQIDAAALRIQTGANIMPARQASWEGNPSGYSNGNGVFMLGPTPIFEVNPTGGKFGPQKLGAIWGSIASNMQFALGDSATDYNIPTEAGKTYIFSLYTYSASAINSTLKVKWSNGTIVTLDSETLNTDNSPTTATRLFGTATAPAGTTGALMIWESTTLAPAGISLDGAQVEEKLTASDTPSSWASPVYTRIDGGLIRTGEIRSTSTLTINGEVYPTWSINTDGNAVLGNAHLRGSLVLGMNDEDTGNTTIEEAGSSLRSLNYVPGESGFAIYSNGLAEFRNVVVGSLPGTAVRPGTLSAEAIEAGSILTSDITVKDTGGLHAYGLMGEDVGLTGKDGFFVYSPYEVPIASYSCSSGIVTITTSKNHGFAVGNKIVTTGLPAGYGTESDKTGELDYVTISATGFGANTFTYAKTTSPADVGTTVVANALAKSQSTDDGVFRRRLIHFPSDGASPNIISGMLTAEEFYLTSTGTISGPTTLDNTTLTIASGVTDPKTAPLVYDFYPQVQLSQYNGTIVGACKGQDGNIYVLKMSSSTIFVDKFDSSTGAYMQQFVIGPRYTSTYIPGSGQTINISWTPRGIVYSSGFNKYYITTTSIHTGPTLQSRNENVAIYDAAFTELANDIGWLSDAGNDAGWQGATIGWDYVNSRLMHVVTFTTDVHVRYFTMDGSGFLTAISAATSMSNSAGLTQPRVLIRCNTPEMGDRIIIKDYRVSGVTGTWANNIMRWTPYTTAGAPVGNQQWPPYLAPHHGGWYDTGTQKFSALTTNGVIEYGNGTTYWSTDSSMTKVQYFKYGYYNDIPSATVAVSTRARTSNVATLVTTDFAWNSNHIGTYVEVVGIDSTFNGWAKILSVPNANTITYASTGSNVTTVSSTGSTIKVGTYETKSSPVGSRATNKRALTYVNTPTRQIYIGEYPTKTRIYGGNTNSQTAMTLKITTPITEAGGLMISHATGNSWEVGMTENGFASVNNPSKIVTTTGDSYWDGTGKAKFSDVNYVGDDWVNVTFQNGWSNYAGGYQTVQYRKEGRKVILRGLATGGTVGSAIFTLPVGFRPNLTHIFSGIINTSTTTSGGASTGTAHTHSVVTRDAAYRINIIDTGVVSVSIPSSTTQSNGYVSLSGIEFYID